MPITKHEQALEAIKAKVCSKVQHAIETTDDAWFHDKENLTLYLLLSILERMPTSAVVTGHGYTIIACLGCGLLKYSYLDAGKLYRDDVERLAFQLKQLPRCKCIKG